MASRFTELKGATSSKRVESVIDGKTYAFQGSPMGDDYFELLYPDIRDVNLECSHQATLCGRSRPFPASIWADVQAIVRTYVPEDGESKPDASEIFPLYDARPAVFAELRGSALIALGLTDNARPNSAQGAWGAAFIKAREIEKALRKGGDAKALAAELRRICWLALKDFGVENEGGGTEGDHPDDTESLMESLSGN
ncbi:hypothetical protein EON81_13410 [bacterium]|nr:MAG: hypothetical protein EON81_13410 [bacterium]